MLTNFKEFLSNLIVEELHPEIQDIVKAKSGYKTKQAVIAKKVKDLTARGERTGIEGNMPKGSSRAYLKHDEPIDLKIDNKPAKMHIGTKVAITASLDKYHPKEEHDGMNLGAMQNQAEGAGHYVNDKYRTLRKEDNGSYTTNKEHGIFPPLVDHDFDNHEWTQVGHARDIKNADEFKSLTKSESHPNGISHKDFVDVLNRYHEQGNGKYWQQSDARERHLNNVLENPVVQKFTDYHGTTGNPTYDYMQRKNLGVWTHPVTGENHLVARDHGYSSEVQAAYTWARSRSSFK